MTMNITELEVADYETAEQAATDWSILGESDIIEIADAVAWRFADDYPNLFSYDDALQEVRLILASRAATARSVAADGPGLLYRWLTQRMRDAFLTTEKRLSKMVTIDELEGVELGRPGLRQEFPAYDLPDGEERIEEHVEPVSWGPQPKKAVVAAYDRAIVEAMLPYVWGDSIAWGMKQDTAPDPDMPRGSKDPSKGWTSFAHVIDVRDAWKNADLSIEQRQAVFARYALDLTQDESASILSAPRTTIEYRIERGVGLLVAHLNGSTYIDSYDQLDEQAV